MRNGTGAPELATRAGASAVQTRWHDCGNTATAATFVAITRGAGATAVSGEATAARAQCPLQQGGIGVACTAAAQKIDSVAKSISSAATEAVERWRREVLPVMRAI